MARLVPETAGRGLHSAAEKKLADRFRAELDDAHVVLHSVGLVRHAQKRWAEADFVVIGSEGIFCLEVKGGRVGRRDGVWTFTDRRGHVSEKYEGPFDQAGGAAGALQSWLADSEVRRDDGARFQVGFGVATPDCVLDATGPDIDASILWDQRDEGEMGDFLGRLGSYWQHRQSSSPLSPTEIERLAEAIRPDFEATMTRSLRAGLVEDELVRFTERQQEVVAGLADNPRVRIRGAAGTGKSLLAVAEARRLASSGRSVLLLCHTGALADWLAGVVADTPEVEVSTAGSLMWRIVDDAKLRPELPDATEDVLFDVFLPELAVKALRAGAASAHRFDSLVVDEAQDLMRGDVLDVVGNVLVGGLAEGQWRTFEDPNQNIFGAPSASAVRALDSGSPARFRLDRNCRNTRQIVEMSTLLSGSAVNSRSEVDGPEVAPPDDWSRPWQERALEAVDALLADGTPVRDIVVLTMAAKQRDELVAVSGGRLSSRPDEDAVRCSTVAGFKGLEATAVVLSGLWGLDEPHLRQAAYVGATRARVVLALALPAEAERSWKRRIRQYAVEAAALAADQADERS